MPCSGLCPLVNLVQPSALLSLARGRSSTLRVGLRAGVEASGGSPSGSRSVEPLHNSGVGYNERTRPTSHNPRYVKFNVGGGNWGLPLGQSPRRTHGRSLS